MLICFMRDILILRKHLKDEVSSITDICSQLSDTSEKEVRSVTPCLKYKMVRTFVLT